MHGVTPTLKADGSAPFATSGLTMTWRDVEDADGRDGAEPIHAPGEGSTACFRGLSDFE